MLIVSEYHGELQRRLQMTKERKKAIKRVKKNISSKLQEEQVIKMEKPISKEEILEAIRKMENNKCPGPSEITYGFWKKWVLQRQESQDDSKLDVAQLLRTVYEDIQRYGVEEDELTRGLMYLKYKKKEKTKIENYRPITLLETDYKILTKVIAKRLGEVEGALIHPNQVGFMPGRSLFDHAKLTSLMPEYAKEAGNEGMIVSLD